MRSELRVTFMSHVLIKVLLLLLFLYLPFSFVMKKGIADIGIAMGSYICLLLTVNIIIYCFVYYRYKVILRFVKEMFQCEENQ